VRKISQIGKTAFTITRPQPSLWWKIVFYALTLKKANHFKIVLLLDLK